MLFKLRRREGERKQRETADGWRGEKVAVQLGGLENGPLLPIPSPSSLPPLISHSPSDPTLRP